MMQQCTVLVENAAFAVVAKPPSLSAVRLASSLEKTVGWKVFAPHSVARNTWDIAVLCKKDEAVEWFRSARKTGKMMIETLTVVHGLVKDPEMLVQELMKVHKDGSIGKCSVLETVPSNQSGYLSLIKLLWCPESNTSSIKQSLMNVGFPIVGKGHCTVRLQSRSGKGTMLASASMTFPCLTNPGKTVTCDFSTVHLERMGKVCKKEKESWERTCQERLKDLLASGVTEEEAREAAFSRDPVAHICGKRKFCDLDLSANDQVFVPRDASTCLVKTAVNLINSEEQNSIGGAVLDLGCGTGCLLLGILKNLQYANWKGIGVDINPAAVSLSSQNASAVGLQERSKFFEGDYSKEEFFASLRNILGLDEVTQESVERIKLIVCNPPYLPEYVAQKLKVIGPKPAVEGGGKDGLEIYQTLAAVVSRAEFAAFLSEETYLILEVPGNRDEKHQRVVEMFEQRNSLFKYLQYGESDQKGMNRCMVFKCNMPHSLSTKMDTEN